MRTARRLSIIALTVLFAAVALAAGERATALVVAPYSGDAALLSPGGTSSFTQAPLASPWPSPAQSPAGPEQAEREKTFAWLILLLKNHSGAR